VDYELMDYAIRECGSIPI